MHGLGLKLGQCLSFHMGRLTGGRPFRGRTPLSNHPPSIPNQSIISEFGDRHFLLDVLMRIDLLDYVYLNAISYYLPLRY